MNLVCTKAPQYIGLQCSPTAPIYFTLVNIFNGLPAVFGLVSANLSLNTFERPTSGGPRAI